MTEPTLSPRRERAAIELALETYSRLEWLDGEDLADVLDYIAGRLQQFAREFRAGTRA